VSIRVCELFIFIISLEGCADLSVVQDAFRPDQQLHRIVPHLQDPEGLGLAQSPLPLLFLRGLLAALGGTRGARVASAAVVGDHVLETSVGLQHFLVVGAALLGRAAGDDHGHLKEDPLAFAGRFVVELLGMFTYELNVHPLFLRSPFAACMGLFWPGILRIINLKGRLNTLNLRNIALPALLLLLHSLFAPFRP
jgi:hypothetical protein